MSDQGSFNILALPAEVREEIYRILLHPSANRVFGADEYNDYNYHDSLVLFRLNQKIYYEARRVFRDLNVFVRIETPWPEAQDHVAREGHAPILMRGQDAANFTGYSLSAAIGSPEIPMQYADPQCFVLLLDDLDKFTQTWFYAHLSNPGLNSHLTLTLHLRDPYRADWEEKHMSKRLQRQLLLPFGMVKGLRDVTISGDPNPFPSVESELRAEQAVPVSSPEHCLSETVRLKGEGNAELIAGNYQSALRIYMQAWEAMHIVVRGRQRHIHAEAFFARELEQDPWEGKNGQTERLALRVQLVANTCLAYLKLEEWDEVCFWGMRTITMVRQAVIGPMDRDVPPDVEAVLTFPSAVQIGKIYYRTAVALKKLADKSQAAKLLRVASIYLPWDENIKKELGECSLRIG